MLVAIICITFLSTLSGGLFALYFKGDRELISAFAAGAITGVGFFDLLPESISLAETSVSKEIILAIVALGFITYMMVDGYSLLHPEPDMRQQNIKKGLFGAGSLSLHSFFDGITIGLVAKISFSLTVIVAIGVIAHDFADGLNTVFMILKNRGKKQQAFKWLLIDSLAPVAGIISTLFFSVPSSTLALILALFTGFFFYLGTNAIMAVNKRRVLTIVFIVLGMLTIFFAIEILKF